MINAEAADDNYTIAVVPGTLTVEKRDLKITANNKTKLWGAPDPELDVTYDNLVEGDAIEFELSREPGESAETPGEDGTYTSVYPIMIKDVAEQQNYNVTTEDATLTIRMLPVRIANSLDDIRNSETIYSGTEVTLTAEMENLNQDTLNNPYVLQWQMMKADTAGNEWIDIDAHGLEYTYILNMNTKNNVYRVVVTLSETQDEQQE